MSEHEHYHHEGEHHHHHHHHEDGENNHHQHEHHHDDHQQQSAESNGNGSNDNGYVVVPPTPQSSVDNSGNQVSSSVDKVIDLLSSPDEIQRMLSDIGSSAETKLNSNTETIRAEADSSSSSSIEKSVKKDESKSGKKESVGPTCSANASFLCPYYLMGKHFFYHFSFAITEQLI